MHVGLCIFATDYSIRPDELARAAEERGFESLFLTEHTHIPAGRRTPFPGGGELPREYSHTLDPFVALMAAAAAPRPPPSAWEARAATRCSAWWTSATAGSRGGAPASASSAGSRICARGLRAPGAARRRTRWAAS